MSQPFFIVGTGRSGSEFLQRTLSAHPRIALTSEAHVADFLYFCSRFASVPQKTTEQFVVHLPVELHGIIRDEAIPTFAPIFRRHATAMLEEFYREHFADEDFTHWGDKLPGPETAIQLQQVLPHAKYIVLIRDPRAVCASLRRFGERDIRAAPLIQAGSVEVWATYIRNTFDALLRYLEQRVIVRYEDMIADPVAEIGRVLDFLGLDGAADLVADAAPQHLYRTHGTSGSPEQSLEAWRSALTAEEIATVESICGELMERFDYATSATG